MRRFLIWGFLWAFAALPVLGVEIELNLAIDANRRVNVTSARSLSEPIDVNGEDIGLSIRCGTVDCSKYKIVIGTAQFRFVPVQDGAETLLNAKVPADNVPGTATPLRVMDDTAEVFRISVTNGRATTAPPPAADDDSDPCWTESLESLGLASTAGVHFLITPGGSIQDRTTEPIDEDDFVFVHVIGSDAVLLNSLEVTRTSATRTTGNLNIVGGSVTGIKLQSREALRCYHRSYELGDFAPGEAVVDISARQDTKRTSLGTLRFNVNKLWNGIVSFGPVWSNVTDRAYALTPRGSEQIIIETENGGDDILYAAQYTYFRRKRDIEKPIRSSLDRINPTLGFSLNDPADHALIGVSFDAGQFVLTAGLHAARVERLSGEAGVSVGGPFTGAASAIPTEKTWDTGVYVAVTIDARAAQVLLNAILPGTK